MRDEGEQIATTPHRPGEAGGNNSQPLGGADSTKPDRRGIPGTVVLPIVLVVLAAGIYFGAASLMCGLAPAFWLLIVGRLLQGAAGPVSLDCPTTGDFVQRADLWKAARLVPQADSQTEYEKCGSVPPSRIRGSSDDRGVPLCDPSKGSDEDSRFHQSRRRE